MTPFEQLSTLKPTASFVVGDEHLDVNGHMNINHYFAQGSDAMWKHMIANGGMDEQYITERGHTTFTVEQHIRYFGECTRGDQIDVAALVLARSDKAVHLAALVINRTREQLSSVVESILVHVNFETRRPAPFDQDVTTALDAAIAADRVPWQVPVSGALGIRGAESSD